VFCTSVMICSFGIIGLTLARQLIGRGSIALIEKDFCGAHASGRNSGVVHAGLYYKQGTLPARLCVKGNAMLKAYCLENKVPFQNIGKIVAPKDDSEVEFVHKLYQNSLRNGAPAHLIDYDEAKEIEPRIIRKEKYVWSPSTSIAGNKELIAALKNEVISKGVKVYEGTQFVKKLKQTATSTEILTNKGKAYSNLVINCAGTYTDKIAQDFGFGLNYKIMPMRGFYLYGHRQVEGFKTLVYPLPLGDGSMLGVHTTNTVSGRFNLGPTALPGLWREQYGGLQNFSLIECLNSLSIYLNCIRSPDLRLYKHMLLEEVKKLSRKYVVNDVATMVHGLNLPDYQEWGPTGIFPQLVDTANYQMVKDFIVEGDHLSKHLLNVVSPGWTCSFALAEELSLSL